MLTANGMMHVKNHHMNWRPPFSWTVQKNISTSTSLLNSNDLNNNVPEDEDVTILPDKEGMLKMQGDLSIPFRRSEKAKSQVESSGFDDRAQAKLAALSKAKTEAEDAKASFISAANVDDADKTKELHEKWNASEKKLALAYSQAIKYTSRINKNGDATKMAELLLFEWMVRFLDSFDVSSPRWNDDKDSAADPKSMYLNKKRMIRSIHKVVAKLDFSESGPSMSISGGEERSSSSPPRIRVPPPSSKDYINLLRAYSMSKARRKGQQCEFLMRNMMQLAKRVTFYYDVHDEEWTTDRVCDVGMDSVLLGDGNETKMWRLWVNESIPNSKAFALAIKCHAGTTHNDSFERVIVLNHIHDTFSECCQSQIPGLYKDDPYVLFHSIKALKNLQKKEEWDKGHQWLRKLHSFVTSPENVDYFNERGDGGSQWQHEQPAELDETETFLPEAQPVFSRTIDVTSPYITFIRLLAQLRGKNGVAADALKVLNWMHHVKNVYVNGLAKPGPQISSTDDNEEPEESMAKRKRIAYVDIRSNAYNLVLGLHRDSKKADDASKAIELLQRMVDAGNETAENKKGVPLPTEQSFEFTILSLANMTDGENALQEAERLIQLMQDETDLEPSAAIYNAHITVCNKQLFGKAQLYDKALSILDEMRERSKANPGASPNPATLALVMQACSLSEHEDREKVLATASTLFSQLEERESSEKSAVALTDRAYFYMMKCVDAHTIDDLDAKKDSIEELFSGACQRGLCSANILAIFRDSVSEEEYRLTVGKGRLADRWIANIRGPRALYTDGSSGGAGKHARRKGKSTSNWANKKRAKEAERGTRRKDKKAKKFFKKTVKMTA
eukprot:CAMPEP_0172532284 /NCGR_PEP_ID=MMETSP1067-20121228/5398_1 /TAXON_ID=265564 ORGANISM="Thalassiosira punctigera, Strain Tpunct2005C2" /NCGR_SAMPLE_ID=MMETSP1067 /ASSEMBLY_ACC=CAM_ASM_000444 /LENGTH=844 /DNA_ID=CAMNT_0013316787 /DNA_START=334 /DNA_END=2868 /DNA_ORIENTATION=+